MVLEQLGTGDGWFENEMKLFNLTLPETNIAPENRPSQKEIAIPTILFQSYVSFRKGIPNDNDLIKRYFQTSKE